MKKGHPALSPPTTERLSTPAGDICYTLTRKRVKNVNLRIAPDGGVAVSAPDRMPKREIEAFLRQKAAWVQKHAARMAARPAPAPCPYTKQECLARFLPVSDAVFPLFADLLRGQKPEIKVREMKSRWGVCHVQKRSITLNTRLAEKPPKAIEYVVLHEYVHFLHPDHGPGFHAEMARLMPDYRQRRKLLNAP